MIQRIQTVFLLLSISCLSMVAFGSTIFTGFIEKGRWVLNSHSLQLVTLNSEEGEKFGSSMYLMFIVLALLNVATIISFKNLKRQILLSRLTAVLFVLGIAITSVNVYLIAKKSTTYTLGSGFYLVSLALLFSFFALIYIKKDFKLIDSLNRLR